MDKIKVLSLQFTPIKADKKANIERIKELIKSSQHTNYDLIALPEFFDTGINISNKEVYELAETEKNSPVLEELSKLAKQYNSYIHCGSICFKEKNKVYNRSYLLNRDGSILTHYDKIHLFNYCGGNEGEYTTAGDKLCIVETDFGKIGLATCFDIRFPQMFTKLSQMGAELFIVPATWLVVKKSPSQQKEQITTNWRLISKARAYDNIAFVITANEVGSIHPMFEAIGNSMIINHDGVPLSIANDKEETIYAELDFEALRNARKIFPVNILN